MRLFLIGMPGSGKSHWASRLGQEMNWPYMDLDKWMEASSGLTIAQMMEPGEAHFRALENEALKTILQEPVPHVPYLIATGGGTPCYADNMMLMQKHGKVVYLETPLPLVRQRLVAQGAAHRPLLANLTPSQLDLRLASMLAQRQAYYERADAKIGTDNLDTLTFVNLIHDLVDNP